MKLATYSVIAIIIIGLLSRAYYEAKKAGTVECETTHQVQQINTQNEIIQEVKIIHKRKQANLAIPINDDLIWLQEFACSDCQD
jgi:hypothetical protein